MRKPSKGYVDKYGNKVFAVRNLTNKEIDLVTKIFGEDDWHNPPYWQLVNYDEIEIKYSVLRPNAAYVWGQTSAGFKGQVLVNADGTLSISGEVRPFNEEFDFAYNGQGDGQNDNGSRMKLAA